MEDRIFTAHNIKLPSGEFTVPSADWTIEESPWFSAAKRILDLTYGNSLEGRRIADLGCLEGGYTVGFAKLSMEALGVEVRESNFSNCLFVRDQFKLPNLKFVRDDVWNIGKYGRFDASFCCGLLYHLDRPREFITLLGQVTGRVLIINTHYASDENETKFNLGRMDVNERLSGRWFFEHDLNDFSDIEKHKWASWENKRSFWLTKSGIMQAIAEAGFDIVFEQYDWLGADILTSMTDGYYKNNFRGQFVGIRSMACNKVEPR